MYFYEKYKKLINSYIEKQNNINPIQNNIYLDKFRVEDKIRDLKNTSGVVLRFNEIIKPCIDKVEIIIIFIAILELVKQNYFKIIQVGKFTDIILEKIVWNMENMKMNDRFILNKAIKDKFFSAIESLLFVHGDPISLKDISVVLGEEVDFVRLLMDEFELLYENSNRD